MNIHNIKSYIMKDKARELEFSFKVALCPGRDLEIIFQLMSDIVEVHTPLRSYII
jgi:hypothetical protein